MPTSAVNDSNILGGLDALKANKNPSKSELDAQKITTDFNNFLLLLTTQLKNQDPTQPLDANQFTQQIVSLSTVEQAVQTNSNLEKLISLVSGSQINNAVSYIGKNVDAEGNKSQLDRGFAEFAYELPAGATKATVSISDSTGKVVFSGDGSAKAGKNIVTWDGTNSFNGNQEPDGVYTITVSAKSGDKPIDAKTYTTGRVVSVDLKEGKMELTIGDGIVVPLEKVISIREAAVPVLPPQTASNAPSGSGANTNNTTNSNNTAGAQG